MSSETGESWDAIVVGSGATGGMACYKLCQLGYRVLLLERSPALGPKEASCGLLRNLSLALYRQKVSKQQRVQAHHPTYWAANPDFFVDDLEQPYATPDDLPFRWIRGGRVGGRTLTWDAVTPRMSDFEFKAASLDGHGVDWPLGEQELAPYYEEAESLLEVFGQADGLAAVPDGRFFGHKEMTPSEQSFKAEVERRFPERHVIISRGMDGGRTPGAGEAYPRISSLATSLARALGTGRLTIRSDSAVRRVLTCEHGREALGVEVVDTVHRTEHSFRARCVFLCASTIESTRLLLNSKSSAHKRGLGGNSGQLGHYLMDHSAGNVYFSLPQAQGAGRTYEFSGSASIMIPRYVNLGKQTETYPRGFGMWGGIQRLPVPRMFRRDRSVPFGFLCARSEVLPSFDNRIELDPHKTDHLGIPVPRITCRWKPEDLVLAQAARRDTEEMVLALGGKPGMVTDHFHTPFVRKFMKGIEKEWTLSTPGMFVHEVGGARMGTDSEQSVVNERCLVHGLSNLFVTDGACWVSSGWQNPTLTEMAITLRAADYAAKQVLL